MVGEWLVDENEYVPAASVVPAPVPEDRTLHVSAEDLDVPRPLCRELVVPVRTGVL